MSTMMPGQAPSRPTSLRAPLALLSIAVGLFVIASWANEHAQAVRATDAWADSGLSAMSALSGVLFLVFAGAGFVRVSRDRRSARLGEALTGR